MDQIVSDFLELSKEKKITPAQVKVLQAAIQLFAEQGYASTSTAAIAEEAGVSQAVIFKYFKNKEGLLNQILDLAIGNILPKYGDDFIDKLEVESGHDSFAEFLTFMLRDRYQFILQNRNLVTIVVSQLMIDDQLVQKLINSMSDKFWTITEILEKLAGPEAKLDGQDILRLLASQLVSIFIEVVRIGIKMTDEAADKRLNQVKEIMLASIY
ncbi:TetR/AcrR family transcriptional regulator [Fructobacillus sp. CRL 2054]|uniref:TetR/AcrR family transcriptional regulator n=1 Tax=Fructobacillus sp. CRL 2054 TaxID=2763007 RepID=UPI0023793002|nr:TetR/AcrR family transcriptional regulator [Fructobacillus sp. CRL 2054]MDD9138896.1 TetR/AcrR family transcriptional regulator [Fructobacillus sp. CRL 2054]